MTIHDIYDKAMSLEFACAYEKTGHKYCQQSPYEPAYAAFKDYGLESAMFHGFAQSMLQFLESLSPEPKPDDKIARSVDQHQNPLPADQDQGQNQNL